MHPARLRRLGGGWDPAFSRHQMRTAMILHDSPTCTFEQLEQRLLVSGTPAADLLASAQALNVAPLGELIVTDRIAEAARQHAYQFTAPARGKFEIHLAADDGLLDPYLMILNSNGRRVRRNDNASRHTVNSFIRLRVRPGRTYFVVASSADGTSGDYTLTLTGIPRDDIGNAFAAARSTRLNTRGSRRTSGRINYPGDVDVFKVVATRTGTMQVDMLLRGRRNDLVCELAAYDAEGTLLVESGNGSGASFEVVKGQTFYLRASGSDGSIGRYRVILKTEERPVPAPPQETPQPAAIVTGRVLSLPSGLQLLVTGTDLSDTITLSQSAADVTLITPAESYTFNGSFSSIVVYGFAGEDAIRLDSTVTAVSWVYAGLGDDTVFEAGPGTATLYGQAGDDLLVSVGGNSDELYGGDGIDSFWVDATDTIRDASRSENAARNVHRIAEFHQPYAETQWSASYVSTEIAGQNLDDPETTSYANGYAGFASVPLFVDGAQYDDVVQGSVGDCYLLAALASLADTDPNVIEQMVAPLGDGTFAVRFFRDGREVYLRVDADLPIRSDGSPAYAKTGPDGEMWVPVVEKAYAHFRRGENSYASINGGWMADVYHEVTDMSTTLHWTSRTTDLHDLLERSLAAGHAVTMGSYYNPHGPIVGSHAYMVKSVQTTADGEMVTIYNPWGVDGRAWDQTPNDGLLRLTVEQVSEYFFALVVSAA